MPTGHASGEAVVGVTAAFTILSLLATFGRLFTRFGIARSPGLDDVFIVLSAIFSIVLTATLILQVKYGMGKHEASLREEDAEPSLFWFWLSVIIYNLALSSAKFSILVQYLRIFPQNVFRKATYALIGIVSAITCWTVFSAIFACTPISFFWTQRGNGKCLNRLAVWFTNAGLTIATDLSVAILPIPVFNSLHLPKRQKIALMVVFALGGVTCIVSLLRLESLYAISVSTDVSWDNPLASIWSSLEVNTAIVCSCLPTLKACVSRFFPRFFTSMHASYGAHGVSAGRSGKSRPQQTTGSRSVSIGLNYMSRHDREDFHGGPKHSSEDVECSYVRPGTRAAEDRDKHGIHVVTEVSFTNQHKQDYDKDGNSASDSESTKKLVLDNVR